MSDRRALLAPAQRICLKVGSSLLASSDGIDRKRIESIAADIEGHRDRSFVLVTSGAVSSGMRRLGLAQRPTTIPEVQATAAVGQIGLMSAYEEVFGSLGRRVGQMLLTRDDLRNRRRYLNAKHTLSALREFGVLPIVNENDTVVVEEIKVGDNDNLSAAVAALAEADLLIILSDVDGLYTADPKSPGAERVEQIAPEDPRADTWVGGRPGALGTGGMRTKLEAARKAAAAGIPTILADGRVDEPLRAVLEDGAGTLILPASDRLTSRKHWIAHTLRPSGVLRLDDGAVRALQDGKRSLLPSGIRDVEGDFGVGECVRCVDGAGREVARGLVSYGAVDLRKIAGAHSSDIEKRLGYKIGDEVVHRDDLVVS